MNFVSLFVNDTLKLYTEEKSFVSCNKTTLFCLKYGVLFGWSPSALSSVTAPLSRSV